ncbi:MAG: CBS domain-containing protein, partial [Pseudomonadota bacterium]
MNIGDISLPKTASVLDALKLLDASAAQIVLVTDANQKLLGVITDGDVRRGLLRGISLEEAVDGVMNKTPKVLRPSDTAAAGRAAMLHYRVLQMPVVEEATGRVVNVRFLSDPRTGGFSDIPVVLMAGGEGRRLRPITQETPKPLIPIGGRPILETILRS